MSFIYMPILKWKAGEYEAVKEVQTSLKERMLPLFEIPAIPWDYVKEKPTKTLENHLTKIPDQLQRSCGDMPVLMDPIWLDLELDDTKKCLLSLFETFQDRHLNVIPVCGLKKENNNNKDFLCNLSYTRNTSICLRLHSDTIFDDSIEAVLEDFFDKCDIPPENIILVLDLGSISETIKFLPKLLIGIINSLPYLDNWQSIIVTATGFPENLSGLNPGENEIRRIEYNLWSKLHSSETLSRKPIFGDYGISHPGLFEMDPRIMSMSANIRYTTLNEWHILKGRNVKMHSYDQFFDLSKTLVESDYFEGEDFSWGDAYLKKCANREVGPGNATTWRRVGNSHHLTYVLKQLDRI